MFVSAVSAVAVVVAVAAAVPMAVAAAPLSNVGGQACGVLPALTVVMAVAAVVVNPFLPSAPTCLAAARRRGEDRAHTDGQ